MPALQLLTLRDSGIICRTLLKPVPISVGFYSCPPAQAGLHKYQCGFFLPTNKELAVIITRHWAMNSEEMQKLPDNVVKTLNTFLEEYNTEEGID